MERMTEHRGKGTIIVDMEKHHESAIRRLAAIEDILGYEYDLDRLRELAQADREGRCVVLPIKVPGWGWCCNREYPNAISAYFAYPSQVVDCMEKYVLRESKEAAEAARREQDGNRI